MAHCPNCSPQPRNEQHTTDRLQNTVEPLLYTRNFMLAKYFKMECECMRCQEFISSIPNMERPREGLRTPKHHTPTSTLFLPILIFYFLLSRQRLFDVLLSSKTDVQISLNYPDSAELTCSLAFRL